MQRRGVRQRVAVRHGSFPIGEVCLWIGLSALWLALSASQASGAMLVADASPDPIGIGDDSMIEFILEIEPGDAASGLIVTVDVLGVGSVVEALEEEDLIPGGPTWTVESFKVEAATAQWTLSSENMGGDRLSGMLKLTGLGEGTAEILRAKPTRGITDIDSVPGVDELWVMPFDGESIAAVEVVPEPGTALLLAGGLAGLCFAGRKRPARV